MKATLIISGMIISLSTMGQGKFFGGNGDGFATASLTNVVLPLQVISFAAVSNSNTVTASLFINTTESICAVQLEKSKDGILFFPIDSLLADYPGLQGNNFHFTDPAQLENKVYYRVKILRCQGSFIYTNIITIRKNNNGADSFIYSSMYNTVNYTVTETGKLELLSSTGQLVYQVSLAAGTGLVQLPAVSSGIYLLRFANGFVSKIIIP